jgi:hypothetical protein
LENKKENGANIGKEVVVGCFNLRSLDFKWIEKSRPGIPKRVLPDQAV